MSSKPAAATRRYYRLCPCLNDQSEWIDVMAQLVRSGRTKS